MMHSPLAFRERRLVNGTGEGSGEGRPGDATRRLRPALISAGVVIVLLLAFFAYSLAHSQAQQRKDLDKRFRDRADVAAAVNEAIFSLASAQAKTTNAQRFSGRTVDPAALALTVQQGNQLYAEVLASKGRVLAATAKAPPRPPRLEPVVTEALRTGRTVYSNAIPGPAGPMFQSATAFKTPYGTRVLLSGVSGPLLASFVSGFLVDLPNVAKASSYVIDGNGRIVGSPSPNAVPGSMIPDRALAAAVAKHRQGSYGDDRYFTSAAIAGTPWRIVLSAAKSNLYASINGAQRTVPWIIFGAFVLAAVLGLFLLRRVLIANSQLQRAELSRMHALEINDNIVQRLVTTKYALERGSTEMSRERLAETLQEAQHLVSNLLEGKDITPGVLRREEPAATEGPPEPRTPTTGGRR
jgi:hypothetical protein